MRPLAAGGAGCHQFGMQTLRLINNEIHQRFINFGSDFSGSPYTKASNNEVFNDA
jgi:hypothetical protein